MAFVKTPPASICTIKEILPGGDYGAIFVWTSGDYPATGQAGGARAAWVQPWGTGIKMRNVRTDFPGTKYPSRQILGSSRKPFTINGKFDDRYNTTGFAVEEMRRLEELVSRGNLVEISHGFQIYVGLITDADFQYRRDWDISYSLQVDLDKRLDEARDNNASPFTVEKPGQSMDDMSVLSDSIAEQHMKRPPGIIGGPDGVITVVNQGLQTLSDDLEKFQGSVNSATGRKSGLGQFQQMSIKAQNIQGDCAGVAGAFLTAKSSTETGIRTAKNVLKFDTWCKTMGFLARLTMGRAGQAHRGLAERQTPATKRLYRPRRGQSVYEVSRECYGTPFAWRSIARANHFAGLAFDGTEILIIPEG